MKCLCNKECTNCVPGFQKIIDLKNAGLVIYRRTTETKHVNIKTENVEYADNTTEDVYILHNTKDTDISSADYWPEIGHNIINCPRCRKLIEHAQNVLKKGPTISGNDVTGICDYCKMRDKPCFECRQVVKRFVPCKPDRTDINKERVKHWLTEIGYLLQDINKITDEKKRAHSDSHIDQICHDRQRSVRKPDVEQLFEPLELDLAAFRQPHIVSRINGQNKGKAPVTHFAQLENLETPIVFKDPLKRVVPSISALFKEDEVLGTRNNFNVRRILKPESKIPPSKIIASPVRIDSSETVSKEESVVSFEQIFKATISGTGTQVGAKTRNITQTDEIIGFKATGTKHSPKIVISEKVEEKSTRQRTAKSVEPLAKRNNENLLDTKTKESERTALIRKYNSAETLVIKIHGIKEHNLKHANRIIFPRQQSNKTTIQKNSSELIKDTKDKFTRAEEEKNLDKLLLKENGPQSDEKETARKKFEKAIDHQKDDNQNARQEVKHTVKSNEKDAFKADEVVHKTRKVFQKSPKDTDITEEKIQISEKDAQTAEYGGYKSGQGAQKDAKNAVNGGYKSEKDVQKVPKDAQKPASDGYKSEKGAHKATIAEKDDYTSEKGSKKNTKDALQATKDGYTSKKGAKNSTEDVRKAVKSGYKSEKETQKASEDGQKAEKDGNKYEKGAKKFSKDAQAAEKDALKYENGAQKTSKAEKDGYTSQKGAKKLTKDTQLDEKNPYKFEKGAQKTIKDAQKAEKDGYTFENGVKKSTKDAQIAKKDAHKFEKGAQKTLKDAQKAEKDGYTFEKGAKKLAKDAQVAEKDPHIYEKGAQKTPKAEKDDYTSEKGAKKSIKDAQVEEKDAHTFEIGAQKSTKDSKIAEKDAHKFEKGAQKTPKDAQKALKSIKDSQKEDTQAQKAESRGQKTTKDFLKSLRDPQTDMTQKLPKRGQKLQKEDQSTEINAQNITLEAPDLEFEKQIALQIKEQTQKKRNTELQSTVTDDLILKLLQKKQSSTWDGDRASKIPTTESNDSEISEIKEPEITDVIIGKRICKIRPLKIQDDSEVMPPSPEITQAPDTPKTQEAMKPLVNETQETIKPRLPSPGTIAAATTSKGYVRYTLSDRKFIDNGWTLLPTEKVVRKMNVYRMRPAHPEFDWFEHNKNKRLMQYDTGEKLAELDDNSRGRWFYRNGRVALDYYDAEELNAGQRFVIYSNGEPDERGRSRPYTLLATFDFSGNGIVFDHRGKIRLKYNQTEGVVLDRSIGPVSHWKWHTLNDPPVLQQVMLDTQIAHKDPKIMKMGGPNENKPRKDNEEMLAIEFDNFIKEKSKKLSQTFKPFQIRMKALKINEHFSLRVLDQATVYLLYRDGTTTLKLNVGMVLDQKEIVDTDTAEVGEVSSSMEKLPARTESLAGLQKSVAHAQHYDWKRTERERKMHPAEPNASVDKLVAGISRPLRPPLRPELSRSTSLTAADYCKCNRKPTATSVYYDTRFY